MKNRNQVRKVLCITVCFVLSLQMAACRAQESHLSQQQSDQGQASQEELFQDQVAQTQTPQAETAKAQASQAETAQTQASQPQTPQAHAVQSQTAQEFVEQLGIGWNLGNSLDPVDCTWLEDDLEYETAWGNPKVTKELIHYVRSEGFNTIRIPVTWKNHIGAAPDYTIRREWIDRVQQVIDWCMEEDLYVILNMHHESSWLTNASKDYEQTMIQYRAIWTQIASRFHDF